MVKKQEASRIVLSRRKMLQSAGLLAGAAVTTTAALRTSRARAAMEENGKLSPFGIGGDAHSSRWIERWMPQMAAIGITMYRSANPNQIAFLDKCHMHFGCLLYGLPPGDKEPWGLPVHDLSGWRKYVINQVKQFKGRVKYWEIWNEPPNGIGRGQTAADYAKVLNVAYEAVHAVDPDGLVGIAAKSVDINWLYQTIKAGGRFDWITLHPYETAGCVITHPGTEMVYLQIVKTLRKMLADLRPAQIHCPIIFTELGCAAGGQWGPRLPGFTAPQAQAHAVVKFYTMGIAQGVDCIEWFEGMDGDSGPMGLLEYSGKPRPAYTAYGQMVKYLGKYPKYLGWVMLDKTNYAFVFRGASRTVLITWASSWAGSRVNFGRQVRIVNPITGHVREAAGCHLTVAPIFVDGVPENLVLQATSNKDKPFPWGGNYTNARSVSITFGRTNVSKGLHTKSAKTVAMDVVAYGGSARSGGVPGGNVFMVDPNFLSYTSTPIEISVVVRRNQQNSPSSIMLNYESTSGFKNTSRYDIPDNKRWYTAKWKITDSQFVNMWGFNFTMNSGSYDIKSVTVTKLDE